MNKKVLYITEDGSHTIADETLHVTYHSTHGAIQESMHVFINAGLNYASLINKDLQQSLIMMHECAGNKEFLIHPLFSFQKIQTGLQQFETTRQFDVIYFDAFDPTVQPELWTATIFKKMFDMLCIN